MLPILEQLPQSTPAHYVRRKAWFIRRDKLHLTHDFLMRGLRDLPGLHNRRLFGLMRDTVRGAMNSETLPFSYDALQVNGGGFRVRAFDIAGKTTIKVVRRDTRYGESTLRELEARRVFLKDSALKIPAIHDVYMDDAHIRFSEEMLIGRAFRDWIDSPRFMREVGAPMMALCERYGISQKPLAETMEPAKLEKIMRCPRNDKRIAAAQDLLQGNRMVAATIAHGDLICSNIIATKNGLYVIDWEKCRETYAGYDFARLALRYPMNPVFARAGRAVLAKFQNGRLSLGDIKILRDGIAASHFYS